MESNGPYRYVRHPMYLGITIEPRGFRVWRLLSALLAAAGLCGPWLGRLGARQVMAWIRAALLGALPSAGTLWALLLPPLVVAACILLHAVLELRAALSGRRLCTRVPLLAGLLAVMAPPLLLAASLGLSRGWFPFSWGYWLSSVGLFSSAALESPAQRGRSKRAPWAWAGVAAVVFAVAYAAPACALAFPEPPLAIVNGTLIDGSGAEPLPDAALVIRRGRIEAVGPRAAVAIPRGARIVDVQGGTILPGFINAHVHGSADPRTLAAWARGGVTTVRDLAGPNLYPPQFLTREVLAGRPGYARRVLAGPGLTVPNGYPIAYHRTSGVVLTASSPADAQQKTALLLDGGADLIKVFRESRFSPLLSPEETAAIVAEAHKRGKLVSAHATTSLGIAAALDAGVDEIAHMAVDTLPDELIARLVREDVYLVPTFEVTEEFRFGGSLNLRRFVEAGGKVAMGSDYAGLPYATFDLGMPMRELRWMQQYGMTPMQIVVASTRNAAHVCGRERDLGTLEIGKIADVLVVDGDPLQNLSALADTRLVIQGGTIIRGAGR